ncbi:MAG: HEAT repeat domain-containing protein, partial [Chloroflexaceae bacterium]|nr:HEAT repeat domain-containing protein [Chloroflexaceae bacterium]
ALRALGVAAVDMALEDVRRLATQPAAPLIVREEALDALGRMGQHPGAGTAALSTLQTIIKNELGNTALVCHAIAAVGTTGNPAALKVLGVLLRADLSRYVARFWQTHAAGIERTPVSDWPTLKLPPDIRTLLLSLLATGITDADQPTSWSEFLTNQVSSLRLSIADALLAIAHHNTNAELSQAVRALLHEMLRNTLVSQETEYILSRLAQLGTQQGANDLALLLGNPDLDPLLHWQAIEQLGSSGATAPVLLGFLTNETLDSFTRGKIAYTLGQRGSLTALPLLRQLADQPDGDLYLRTQAVRALGLLGDSATETTLLHIVSNPNAPAPLRGAAAEALPDTLHEQSQQWLRELLRQERQPAALVVGVLRVLGRLRDREALGILLHYAQNTQPAIATAALEALAGVGDESVIPMLLQLAQDIRLDSTIRLQAVRALLDLRGREHVGLLRTYLEGNVLSLQLRAFESLLHVQPTTDYPLAILTTRAAALALRTRAIEALTDRHERHSALHTLLQDQNDDLHLRVAAARVLATSSHPHTLNILEQCITAPETPFLLVRECLVALAAHAHLIEEPLNSIYLSLSELATDATHAPIIHDWVARILLNESISHTGQPVDNLADREHADTVQ